MKRRYYYYKVIALGISPHSIERNIRHQKEQGWSLISTYVDVNRALVNPEPTVMGVFETWEKK